jgi:hypothetical protein
MTDDGGRRSPNASIIRRGADTRAWEERHGDLATEDRPRVLEPSLDTASPHLADVVVWTLALWPVLLASKDQRSRRRDRYPGT